MTDKKNPIEITFMPGCFDNFDGTQEELDLLIQEITADVKSGEFFKRAVTFDADEVDDLDDFLDGELLDDLLKEVNEDGTIKRNLQ